MALEIQDWYELRSISVRKFCEHKERVGARPNKKRGTSLSLPWFIGWNSAGNRLETSYFIAKLAPPVKLRDASRFSYSLIPFHYPFNNTGKTQRLA